MGDGQPCMRDYHSAAEHVTPNDPDYLFFGTHSFVRKVSTERSRIFFEQAGEMEDSSIRLRTINFAHTMCRSLVYISM